MKYSTHIVNVISQKVHVEHVFLDPEVLCDISVALMAFSLSREWHPSTKLRPLPLPIGWRWDHSVGGHFHAEKHRCESLLQTVRNRPFGTLFRIVLDSDGEGARDEIIYLLFGRRPFLLAHHILRLKRWRDYSQLVTLANGILESS